MCLYGSENNLNWNVCCLRFSWRKTRPSDVLRIYRNPDQSSTTISSRTCFNFPFSGLISKISAFCVYFSSCMNIVLHHRLVLVKSPVEYYLKLINSGIGLNLLTTHDESLGSADASWSILRLLSTQLQQCKHVCPTDDYQTNFMLLFDWYRCLLSSAYAVSNL